MKDKYFQEIENELMQRATSQCNIDNFASGMTPEEEYSSSLIMVNSLVDEGYPAEQFTEMLSELKRRMTWKH